MLKKQIPIIVKDRHLYLSCWKFDVNDLNRCMNSLFLIDAQIKALRAWVENSLDLEMIVTNCICNFYIQESISQKMISALVHPWTVLQGFSEVGGGDAVSAGEIGECACEVEYLNIDIDAVEKRAGDAFLKLRGS
jgi:hypothetical protein